MTTAAGFFEAWMTETAKTADSLAAEWDNLKPYTELILSDDGIIGSVARALGLECYSANYYSTDAILYRPEDLMPGRDLNQFWFRGLEVAFEHEHKYNRKLYQEVGHLLILAPVLRVLVSYPPRGDDRHLDYLHTIIAESRYAEEIHRQKSFLFIRGYVDPLKWSGLIFTQHGWEEI